MIRIIGSLFYPNEFAFIKYPIDLSSSNPEYEFDLSAEEIGQLLGGN